MDLVLTGPSNSNIPFLHPRESAQPLAMSISSDGTSCGEMRKVSRSESGVAFEWTPIFCSMSDSQKEHCKSPEMRALANTWFFDLYPNGFSRYSRIWIPLVLRRRGHQFRNVRFTIGFKLAGENERIVSDRMYPKETWVKVPKVIRRYKLLNSEAKVNLTGQLTITFKLWTDEQPTLQVDSTLQKHLKDLLLTGDDHDVAIKVRNQEFRAHKSMLRARSPVFAAMFKHQMKESEVGSMTIDDCDPDAFGEFLNYVYTGKVEDLSPRKATGLYHAGDKYGFSGLKEVCVQFLEASLSTTSICDVVNLATRHGEKGLLESAIKFFSENSKEILMTVEWQRFAENNFVELLMNFSSERSMLLKEKDLVLTGLSNSNIPFLHHGENTQPRAMSISSDGASCGEMREVSRSESGVAFEWTPIFCSMSDSTNEHFRSPEMRAFANTWFFRLYSNGCAGKLRIWIPLFLCRRGHVERDVWFTIGFKLAGETEQEIVSDRMFPEETFVMHVPKLLQRSKLLNGESKLNLTGQLTITCQLWTDKQPTLHVESTLQKHLKELLLTGDDHDVAIKVGNKEFRAHKSMLRVRSPVFAAMFEHQMRESQDGSITIDDCDPDAFGEFLSYVYTGKVEDLSPKKATGLYHAGDKYDFSGLKEVCVQFLEASLSTTSICEVVDLATRHGEKGLLESAIKFFSENTKEILMTVEWQRFAASNFVAANELFLRAVEVFEKREGKK